MLRANDSGGWTRPSPQQYPHQWNWDSAFVSLGWATFDWERAAGEIESMLAGRWKEGMVPHVRYDAGRWTATSRGRTAGPAPEPTLRCRAS
ncbi:MAG: hypothetical protein DLM67_07915 [Candidatus Nephthysia bennettiae]|nr:MAG: hypothetical protein DLM67_07915 [Candidatus Dormibacteraeota bacterium]